MADPIVYAGPAKVVDARLRKAKTGSTYIGIEYEVPDKRTFDREWYLTPKAVDMTRKAMSSHGLNLDADLKLGLSALLGSTVHIVVRESLDQNGHPRAVVWWMDAPPEDDEYEAARQLLAGANTDDPDEMMFDEEQ